jgi:hypothetical protein
MRKVVFLPVIATHVIRDGPILNQDLRRVMLNDHVREDAHDELSDYGDDHESFPTSCPWTLDELLHHEFWPR